MMNVVNWLLPPVAAGGKWSKQKPVNSLHEGLDTD